MIIVALHGFFGVPADWRDVLVNLDPESEAEVVTPDIAVWATRAEITDFDTFAASFNRSVKLLAEERREEVLIAGYSLGARLAAHCILDEPDLYRSAVLISMNPGLPAHDLQARRERVEFDFEWAGRMRRDPWENTWKTWNEQPVLKPGSRAHVRGGATVEERRIEMEELSRRIDGRREAWARAMEIWSLGLQADLRSDLVEWAGEEDRRLTLITGTDDVKFTELTTNWVAKGSEGVRHRLILGAGHRILSETPNEVVSEISSLVATEG